MIPEDEMSQAVSVVVITRNRKSLLERALSSVLSQTLKELEIIVVDDGSTDGTREWMEDFSARHAVKYIYNTDGLGGNHVRNIGIRAASGKYSALLDDDDEWLPGKTEKQFRLLESDPETGVASCGRLARYDDGRDEAEDPSLLPEGDLRETIFTDLHFTSSRLMIRRSLLEEAGLFDENLRAWQDYELMIRLCQRTRVGIVRENLVRYYIAIADPNRVSNQLTTWRGAVDYIHRKHAALLDALPPETLRRHRIMVCRDGEKRADRAGDRRALRTYLKEEFRLNPTAENLKRFLLNRNLPEKPSLAVRLKGKILRALNCPRPENRR